MNGIRTDFSACIAAGGDTLKKRIADVSAFYSQQSAEYFSSLCQRYGRSLEENACGFLLLDSLLQKNGINRSELIIVRGEHGRPYFANRTNLDFSVSYSEGGTLCCLAMGEGASVGADIQREHTYSKEKLNQLAVAFMNSDDYEGFENLGDAERTDRFYTLWTRREAYLKRVNAGVFDDLSDIDFLTEDYTGGVITISGNRYYYSINATVTQAEEDT